jgi:hypothetical protein
MHEQLLRYLIERGRHWVAEQRAMHREAARPLADEERLALAPFFEAEVLEQTRLKTVLIIENPEFYIDLERMGVPTPLDFRLMSAITFEDTVLLSRMRPPENRLGLLFHELVHVAQYRELGLARFIERYVLGWAENDYDYKRIPVESHAYELQGRFEAAPGEPFPVREEVITRLAAY